MPIYASTIPILWQTLLIMSLSVSLSSQIYNAPQKRSAVLNIENVKVCQKPTSTHSQVFTQLKDQLPPQQTNGAVYKLVAAIVTLCTMPKPTKHL